MLGFYMRGYGAVDNAYLSDEKIETALKMLLTQKKPDLRDLEFVELLAALKASQQCQAIIAAVKKAFYETPPATLAHSLAIARANDLERQFAAFTLSGDSKKQQPPLSNASSIFGCFSKKRTADEPDSSDQLLDDRYQALE
jgi:hypothetical protein